MYKPNLVPCLHPSIFIVVGTINMTTVSFYLQVVQAWMYLFPVTLMH